MAIKLQLEGFDELLRNIEKAGGKIDSACETTMKQSAQIMQNEIVSAMQKENADDGLTSRLPSYEVEKNGNIISARVGFKKGAYNPNNLSDGYKAVFLNYGTPRRKKHGKERARGFIQRAKSKAAPQIKKQQKATLEKILDDLKG